MTGRCVKSGYAECGTVREIETTTTEEPTTQEIETTTADPVRIFVDILMKM